MGFYNYRRFIKNYAKLEKPLNVLMAGIKNSRKSGNIGATWTEKAQTAFISLLEAFENAPYYGILTLIALHGLRRTHVRE